MNANSLLDHWRRARKRHTREQFVAHHSYPFLISGLNPAAKGAGANRGSPLEFDTQIQGPTSRLHARPMGKRAMPAILLPLRRAVGSASPDRLSVGRAPACDLVVADPSVSKLHGHFSAVTLASALFTDASSANGTRIDAFIVPPGGTMELKKFHHIAFGRVRLLMVSAAEVYDWLDSAQL